MRCAASHQHERALDPLLDGDFEFAPVERELIAHAVARAGGNLTRAAQALGMTRPQLAYRFRKRGDEA